MAVAVDAKSTAESNTASVTTATHTNLTVGTSLSNGALLFFGVWDRTVGVPTSISMHWDSTGTNQAMTLLGTLQSATNSLIAIFGLRNPTSGNKTLSCSWTTTSTVTLYGRSYTGVDQASDAAAFKNFNTNTGTSTTASVAITSAVNDFTAALFTAENDLSANTQTLLWNDSGLHSVVGAASEATGAASVTHQFTVATAVVWRASGIDLGASGTTVALPFNTYDYPKVWDIHQAPFDFSVQINPNLFKNLVPFNQIDWAKSFRTRRSEYDKSVSLNPNLFTNTFPKNEYQWWLKPFGIRVSPYDKSVGLNPNIFTNFYPFLNQLGPPFWEPRLPVPQQPYNQALYTIIVVSNPFNQTDWSVSRRPFLSETIDQALNINLYTNPIPFFNAGPTSFAISYFPIAQQIYNPNLYQVSVSAQPFNQTFFPPVQCVPSAPVDFYNLVLFQQSEALPFNVTDWSVPYRLRSVESPDQVYNPNLYAITVTALPFNQTDWTKPSRISSISVPDFVLNPNLSTNPYPLFNQFMTSFGVAGIPAFQQPYNPNLYSAVVVVALPFNQTDWAVSVRQKALPQPDQPININLLTNPYPVQNISLALTSTRSFPLLDASYNQAFYVIPVAPLPFNQTDWSAPSRIHQIPVPDFSLNLNLFANPYPVQNLFGPVSEAVIVSTPSQSYNLNFYAPANPYPFQNINLVLVPTRSFPLLGAPYNQVLYAIPAASFPFNTYDYPKTIRVKVSPYDLSQSSASAANGSGSTPSGQQTYSQNMLAYGQNLQVPTIRVGDITDCDRALMQNPEAWKGAMSHNEFILCKNPDGSQSYYRIDAERSIPGVLTFLIKV